MQRVPLDLGWSPFCTVLFRLPPPFPLCQCTAVNHYDLYASTRPQAREEKAKKLSGAAAVLVLEPDTGFEKQNVDRGTVESKIVSQLA